MLAQWEYLCTSNEIYIYMFLYLLHWLNLAENIFTEMPAKLNFDIQNGSGSSLGYFETIISELQGRFLLLQCMGSNI